MIVFIGCKYFFPENETELSFFRLEDYLVYKENPHLVWWQLSSQALLMLSVPLPNDDLYLENCHLLITVPSQTVKDTQQWTPESASPD